ncbi:MAG: Flp family type IVb pilin [Actinomycetota bacterium]
MLLAMALQALEVLRYVRARHVDERGATAVEYGLMLALIAAVIAAVVGLLGDEVAEIFSDYIESTPW